MLFFVLCHEIIVIILTSLLKGITWEVFYSIAEEQEEYMERKATNQKNYKSLKKRLDKIDQVRSKIEKQQALKPDNLISRELIEKKIDIQILNKLIEIETKNRGTMFYHKKKKSSIEGPRKEFKLRKFDSILIGSHFVQQSRMESATNLHPSSSPNIQNQLKIKPEDNKNNKFLKPPSINLANHSQ